MFSDGSSLIVLFFVQNWFGLDFFRWIVTGILITCTAISATPTTHIFSSEKVTLTDLCQSQILRRLNDKTLAKAQCTQGLSVFIEATALKSYHKLIKIPLLNLDQTRPSKQCKSLIWIMILGFLCYRICRAEQLSRGTLLRRILLQGTLIYDGTGSI